MRDTVMWPVTCGCDGMVPVADNRPKPCKICGAPSPLCGVVDFHKSCAEAQGKRMPLSGIPIYYRRCVSCRFLFTDAFDHWTDQEFQEQIYNRDYIHVDPEYVEVRPTNNANLIANTFSASKSMLRILDYGGGNGLLAERLRKEGFKAESYDQFSENDQLPGGKFDLITCFEVAEHAPSPSVLAASLDALLDEQGVVLFSTLLQPANIEELGVNWWYVGPRNGHVSLYTAAALGKLFGAHRLRVGSFNESTHLAYRTIPSFASHLRLLA